MEKYNLTAFSKGAELRVSWYPTERPQGMAEFSEWQSSKVEYKVSDESSIELADLIRNGMKDINPKYLFSRYGMDLQKGIPIQHLEDRIEIPPIKKTEDFVVKLKPLPEEENQETLWMTAYSILIEKELMSKRLDNVKELFIIKRK